MDLRVYVTFDRGKRGISHDCIWKAYQSQVFSITTKKKKWERKLVYKELMNFYPSKEKSHSETTQPE